MTSPIAAIYMCIEHSEQAFKLHIFSVAITVFCSQSFLLFHFSLEKMPPSQRMESRGTTRGKA